MDLYDFAERKTLEFSLNQSKNGKTVELLSGTETISLDDKRAFFCTAAEIIEKASKKEVNIIVTTERDSDHLTAEVFFQPKRKVSWKR